MKPSSSLSSLLQKTDRLETERRALRPLDSQEMKQLQAYYKIGLTYASNALEGNSLTETETKVVLEDGITIGGKPLRDHLEVQGHGLAFDYLLALAKGSQPFTAMDVCELHRLFYHKIDAEQAGRYRRVRVFLSGSELALPSFEAVPDLMAQLETDAVRISKAEHPVVAAAIYHKRLVDIHPFVDGNGRVARLIMNLELNRHGYPLAIIPPVLRVRYLDSLKAADRGEEGSFFELIAQMVIEGQKDYLRLVGDAAK